MLVSVTVETNQKRPLDVGTRMINATYWHNAYTVETTKTRFEYALNFKDRREKPSLLKTTEALATLATAADLAPTTLSITLPIHIGDDVGTAAVNRDFQTGDIVWGAPLGSDPANKSYVWILNGAFKAKRYLVDLTLAEIIALVT